MLSENLTDNPNNQQEQIVIITGMSGAGRSVALKSFEDLGFEAIDNLPLSLLPTVVAQNAHHRNLAVGVDIRNRDFHLIIFASVLMR